MSQAVYEELVGMNELLDEDIPFEPEENIEPQYNGLQEKNNQY